MPEFIVLPPLSHAIYTNTLQTLDAQTAVFRLSNGQSEPSFLGQALLQHPKAIVALHPIDAPLHLITLPPLPTKRRNAALRVKLEDQLLNEPAQLVLAVHPVGQNRFEVASVSKAVLLNIHTTLATLGYNNRPISALSTGLPKAGGEWLFNGWTLWRDEQGAGALPANLNTPPLGLGVTAAPQPPELSTVSLITPLFFPNLNTHNRFKDHWRWPLILASLCATVWLTSYWLKWRSLLTQERQIQTSITKAFSSALPNIPMIDPVMQLQRAIANDGNEGANDKNGLTQALAKLPSNWPSGAVNAISWNSQRLNLTLDAHILALDEAQKNALIQEFSSKNIVITWNKP